MKYNIHINQYAVVKADLQYKLDLKDLAIIDYLHGWISSTRKKEKDGHIWINYNHLMKEMPLLNIDSKSSISERINKLKELEVIELIQTPDNTLYFKPTELFEKLIFSEDPPVRLDEHPVRLDEHPVRLDEHPVRLDEHPVRLDEQHNNNTINNNTINNNTKSKKRGSTTKVVLPRTSDKLEPILTEVLLYWNNKVRNVKGLSQFRSLDSSVRIRINKKRTDDIISTVRTQLAVALVQFSTEEVKDIIDNYVEVFSSDEYYYSIAYNLCELFTIKKVVQFQSKSKPREKFMNKSLGIVDIIKRDFKPVRADEYDERSPLNKSTQQYMGFDLGMLKSPELYFEDVERGIEAKVSFRDATLLWELELCIASFLWNSKKLDEDDRQNLKFYYKIWQRARKLFLDK